MSESAVSSCRSVEAVLKHALRLCKSSGLTPSRAAVAAMRDCPVDDEGLRLLAGLGLASMVNDRLHHERERNRDDAAVARRTPIPQGGGSTPTERRAALYSKVLAALGSLYEAADGSMKRLSEFGVADHEYRLRAVSEEAKGLASLAKFHTSAIKTLRAAKAETISDLGAAEQRRLAGMLA